MEFFFGICTIIPLIINLPTKSSTKYSVGESFVDNFLSVSNKTILLPMNLLTEKECKKKYPLHSVGISTRKIPYVILLVII
jgi:hypothetical protein